MWEAALRGTAWCLVVLQTSAWELFWAASAADRTTTLVAECALHTRVTMPTRHLTLVEDWPAARGFLLLEEWPAVGAHVHVVFAYVRPEWRRRGVLRGMLATVAPTTPLFLTPATPAAALVWCALGFTPAEPYYVRAPSDCHHV